MNKTLKRLELNYPNIGFATFTGTTLDELREFIHEKLKAFDDGQILEMLFQYDDEDMESIFRFVRENPTVKNARDFIVENIIKSFEHDNL